MSSIQKFIMAIVILAIAIGGLNCASQKNVLPKPVTTQTEALNLIKKQCEEQVGPRRVEKISEHVWVALGHELASTILIHTGEGNIIVDASLCCAAARAAKEDLLKAAPAGPVKAIIYTHSHVDHTMGSTVWAERDQDMGNRKL